MIRGSGDQAIDLPFCGAGMVPFVDGAAWCSKRRFKVPLQGASAIDALDQGKGVNRGQAP